MLYEKIHEDSGKEKDRIFTDYLHKSGESEHGLFGKTKVCLPGHYKNIYQKIKHLDVRDDDIYVCSFPRSGTTWTQEMVWLIMNDLNYTGAETIITSRFPFLEVEGLMIPVLQLLKEDNSKKESIKSVKLETATKSVEYVEKMSSPRYIKTHLHWELLPEQLTSVKTKAKIIYVAREVKDCLVSLYFQTLMLNKFKVSFNCFYEMFINDRFVYTPFWPHVMDFWKRRHQENIFFIRYEDMKSDLVSVIVKVCSFLGKTYTGAQIKVLADHLSFESMKANPAVNREYINDLKNEDPNNENTLRFIRSGKVGDHMNHMTEEQIARINTIAIENTKGSNYELYL